MKRLYVIALLCLIFAAPALAENTMSMTPSYSSIAADLPLMPGLSEKPDSLVLFDKTEGRIAEITMTATPSQIAILEYYAETLPALGWHAENPQIWRRRDEQLTLRFNADKTLTFQLEPHKAAGRSSFGNPKSPTAPEW